MAAILLASPILPGKLEAWRRFCQELQETRRSQYVESRRRLGITGERVGLLRTAKTEIAVIYIEAAQPEQLLPRLIDSEQPFDRWFKRRIRELHGVDVRQPSSALLNEVVFEWSDSQQNLTT